MMIFQNIFSRFFAVALILSFNSCDKSIKEPEQDSTPPQAMILFPIDGTSVNNETVILARAVDNEKVSHVEFYINQDLMHTDSTADEIDIFSYRWNTTETILDGDSSSSLYPED